MKIGNKMNNTGSPDMKTIKILDSICYLIPCRDGYILVDTGYPGRYDEFIKKMHSTGVDINEIKFIFLTHHHNDHAGIVNELRKQSNARLIVHKDEIDPLSKGISVIGNPVNLFVKIANYVYSLFTDYEYPPVAICKDDFVIQGDDMKLLKEAGCDGIILHTPGHTKGSISILLNDGRAVVGDLVMTQSRFLFSSPKPVIIDDMNDLSGSWKKIKDYGANIILPSHGKQVTIDELGIDENILNNGKSIP